MMERIIKEYSYLSEIFFVIHFNMRGCRARDRMVVEFTTTYASVSITTDGVTSNLDQGEVYNIM
jgi:hypothetical protein